ncbi:MAG: FAD-dependent monooxygenase [Tatlockia sp.]|jgi:2-polyprenyl-6-methoxyphenol hydroxylase-like FAD-dependent oxidoreductase
MSATLVDVLVVGAGPVGLFCANELARHGLSLAIVEQKSTLSDKSKALGIHIRTLDVLADCGFLEEVLQQGQKIDGLIFKSFEKELINASFADITANYPYLIALPQDKTEKILVQGLQKKGFEVQWNTELLRIEQNTNTVKATVCQNGEQKQIRANWIIACDGSHSTLRKLVYAGFIGGQFKESWWLADLSLDWQLPENKMVFFISKEGPLACFPMGNKRYRLVMTAPQHCENKALTFKDIEQVFFERCSEKASLSNPVWLSAFGISHRQIQHYRYNRVFFAGDAAHIHSPMGGQGMNTGIQDAYNLVWKLALVHKKRAGESLLDSYQCERFPVARKVLKKTGIMTSLVTLKNPLLIALRNLLLQTITAFKWTKNFFLTDLAELKISYAKSPVVAVLGQKTAFKAGEFLSDFWLTNALTQEKRSLQQITQGTKHHLFLFEGLTNANRQSLLETRALLNKQFDTLIETHIVSGDFPTDSKASLLWVDEEKTLHNQYGIKEPTALLLRPDKYIGLTQSPVDKDALLRQLEKDYINNFSVR